MECPKRFSEQIEDLFFYHNRKVRQEQTGKLIHYQTHGGSMSTIASRFYSQDNNSPNHLYVAVWYDNENWEKLHFSVCCEEQRIIDMVTPLMEKYVKDMEEYRKSS